MPARRSRFLPANKKNATASMGRARTGVLSPETAALLIGPSLDLRHLPAPLRDSSYKPLTSFVPTSAHAGFSSDSAIYAAFAGIEAGTTAERCRKFQIGCKFIVQCVSDLCALTAC
jgi:hypothetical protein